MQLVYPIYLDLPMMTAFLASLEGGFADAKDVETKSSTANEKNKKGSISAKVGELLSGILSVDAAAEVASKVAASTETHSKNTIRFPSASLFIRLREILIGEGILVNHGILASVNDIEPGQLIEFEGTMYPSPSITLRRLFEQLIPVLEPIQKLKLHELEKNKREYGKLKANTTIEIEGTPTRITQEMIANVKRGVEVQMQEVRDETKYYSLIGEALTAFIAQDDTIAIIESGSIKSIARIFPEYSRNNSMVDLLNAPWRCIAKVVGIIPEHTEYDLLRDSPIAYVAKNQLSEFFNHFKGGPLTVPVIDPVVAGPALIIAPLALFA